MTFYCPNLKCFFKIKKGFQQSYQTDGGGEREDEREGKRESKMVLWWSWFTDLNCSVHSVAHSYFSPRQSELKLEEFKVTFMFSYDAFGSASCDFY